MEQLDLIQNRRREVDDQIARLQAQIDSLRAEHADLDIAERVMASLTGAKRPAARAPDEPRAAEAAGGGAAAPMTWAERVVSVLTDAYERQGQVGLSPKQIGERIENKFKVEVKGPYISSIVWRMWYHQKRLKKIREGVYSLPETNEATDLLSGPDQSAASDVQPNRTNDREVASGGGT